MYEHKIIEKADELFKQHKKELGKGGGMLSLVWKALAPSIPQMLEEFDKDEELLEKAKAFIKKIAEIAEEE